MEIKNNIDISIFINLERKESLLKIVNLPLFYYFLGYLSDRNKQTISISHFYIDKFS
jgi:hypothetical protein